MAHPELTSAGRNRTQKEVEKQIADLNIQLDNLCQFLPQVRCRAPWLGNRAELLG